MHTKKAHPPRQLRPIISVTPQLYALPFMQGESIYHPRTDSGSPFAVDAAYGVDTEQTYRTTSQKRSGIDRDETIS